MAHNFFAIWATREAASKCINRAKALNTVTSLLRSLGTWGYKHKMVSSFPVIAPFTFPCWIFLLAHLHGTLGRLHIFPVPGVLQSFSLNLDVNPCLLYLYADLSWDSKSRRVGGICSHKAHSLLPELSVDYSLSWLSGHISWLSWHVDSPKWVDSSWHVDSPAWPLMTSYLGWFL